MNAFQTAQGAQAMKEGGKSKRMARTAMNAAESKDRIKWTSHLRDDFIVRILIP